MSFLANPPTPVADSYEDRWLSNDGFFPDIDLADLRATARLDGTVTQERLRYSASAAVVSVNAELANFKTTNIANDRHRLYQVPCNVIGGEAISSVTYRRAVYSYVQADLIERYRDFDTTGAGDKAADKLELRVADLRRDVRWAISDLLGIRRTTVELI